MTIVASIIYLSWFLSEILLNRLLRAGREDRQRDRGSLAAIWIVIIICVNVAVWLGHAVPAPITAGRQAYYIGLTVILLGMILRFMAISSLGRMFTVNVSIRKGHQLKQDGMYRLVRHPSYAASLLSFAGFGLSLNNWYALALAFIPVLIAFLYRVRIEEALLTEQFGDTYLAYKKRTRRFIPWIY